MASGIARGRVRTTTTTVESRNMAAIGEPYSKQQLTETCSLSLPRTMTSCYNQLTPVKSSYPLTNITYPFRGLKSIAHRTRVFYKSWPLTKWWFLIESRPYVRLTCWKQSRVVRKAVISNPGLKVNQIITVSSLQMFFFCFSFCFCVSVLWLLNSK